MTSDIQRMRHEMDEDDGEAPPWWDPQDGDALVGELLRYEDRTTRLGECKVAIIQEQDDDGEPSDTWSVFLTRNVLKNEFERQAPNPGDMVGLKYFGLKEGRAGGTPYHLYRLRVVRKGYAAPGVITTTPPRSPVTGAGDDDEAPL